jgi:hypothetical protein
VECTELKNGLNYRISNSDVRNVDGCFDALLVWSHHEQTQVAVVPDDEGSVKVIAARKEGHTTVPGEEYGRVAYAFVGFVSVERMLDESLREPNTPRPSASWTDLDLMLT